MKQVISFLGSGKYQEARYAFEGEIWPATKFFGLALARRLRPNRLVLLGTAGSMWDVLLADHLGDADFTEAHNQLLEAAKRAAVTAEQLESLRPLIERAVGIPAQLEIIPDCRTPGEQSAILSVLADLVAPGDALTLDLTHGYRHLPMLGLVAAAYLRAVRGAAIERLAYGALQMQGPDAVAPVLDLRGMLDILDWVSALAAFDASGDLARVAPALEAAGLAASPSNALRQAAFDERNLNTERAVANLGAARKAIAELHSPALDLFRPQLEARLAWIEGNERWRHEAALAYRELDRGDCLRAAALFSEAAISRHLTQQGTNPSQRVARDRAEIPDDAYRELKDIRNALAHGNPSRDSQWRDRIATLIGSRDRLPARLLELAPELGLDSKTTSLPNGAARP